MADLSSFFSGSVPGSVTDSTVTTGSTPAWWQEFLRTTMADAAAQSTEPYQQFPGQTVAGINPALQGAMDTGAALNNPNIAGSVAGGVPGAINTTLAGYDPNQTANYMNPYLSNVTDTMGTLAQRQFAEQTMPTINDQFLGHGQFGSTRQAETVDRAARDMQLSLSQAQGQALNTGYQQAQTNQLTNLNQLTAAQQAAMNTGIKAAGAGEAAGQLQQNQDQANINAARSEFDQQTQYPWQQLSNLSDIMRGVSINGGSSTTSATPAQGGAASPFGNLAGALAQASGTTAKGFARGGPIRMARGGLPRTPAAMLGGSMRPGINPSTNVGGGALRVPTLGDMAPKIRHPGGTLRLFAHGGRVYAMRG